MYKAYQKSLEAATAKREMANLKQQQQQELDDIQQQYEREV